MPPASSPSPSGTQALIGPPPPTIPAVAIGSFLLMVAILYYLFFRFTFTYDYDGVLVVQGASPRQVVVTIPKGQNLDGLRTNEWLATIRPALGSERAVMTHRLGLGSSGIKNNAFSIPYRQPLRAVQVGVPVACRVRLTSAPLIQKLL